MTKGDSTLESAPADVAAIMHQVRLRISERQSRQIDKEIGAALHCANQQWDKVYEPLKLSPPSSLLGRIWHIIRMRLHQEVRGYLDLMIYRQIEFNSTVVRAVNNLARRSQHLASEAEIESLRDEIIQLREQVRRLEEQTKK